MPIGSRATSNGNQMSSLRASQGLPSALLHFIMQHTVKPAFGKALGNVLDRSLRHRKRLDNFGFIPPISQFQ